MTTRKSQTLTERNPRVTLKTVAKRVGLTPGTVSAILNNSPACRSIPEPTKIRTFAAARDLNYKPNFWARALRVKRTYTIGVIAAEIGDPYGSGVISGVERYLQERDFFYLTVTHRHQSKLLESYSRLLLERGVEGYITVDTSVARPLPLPAVAVAGHHSVEGVTNINIDHRKAVLSVLQHLTGLGHQDIAFMKGPANSSDSEDRWKAIAEIARELGIPIHPDLTVELNDPFGRAARAPEYGYPFAKELLCRNRPFSALFAYNDNSAMAAIKVFQDAGLRVPEDISVVGFDDIQAAGFTSPSLTTVRQPLDKMGEIAASTLLDRIEGCGEFVPEIAIEPMFVARQSTGPAPTERSQLIGLGSRHASLFAPSTS
jgi:DNA-binding LacI/PurR family transcriptional regulator